MGEPLDPRYGSLLQGVRLVPRSTARGRTRRERRQPLEPALQAGDANLDPLTIEEIVIDLDAAIPGLTGEDLGRALVFKRYAFVLETDSGNP
ncbi:MAG: hypothetical protein K0R44_1333 [Thermomicrobiales bacterium]|jgi:hypothetical protein|nr:hypothetical protein [Thermomicrobiales bacterium]